MNILTKFDSNCPVVSEKIKNKTTSFLTHLGLFVSNKTSDQLKKHILCRGTSNEHSYQRGRGVKVQNWPHIILKNNAQHRIKTIY